MWLKHRPEFQVTTTTVVGEALVISFSQRRPVKIFSRNTASGSANGGVRPKLSEIMRCMTAEVR
ncbi:MAG: hypothetical protein CMJ64_17825 [Planctomycetaceae bacterium]|nr:hypothetical protein [Planctomycetaceae bacterium]